MIWTSLLLLLQTLLTITVEIIFGNGTNPDTKDAMDVTVIAADFVDRDDVPEAAAPKAATTYTANFTQKADDAKADAEAMHKAGVKAADKSKLLRRYLQYLQEQVIMLSKADRRLRCPPV